MHAMNSETRNLKKPIESDPRWEKLLARDRSADGQFWYSVATTKVYCRPSCPSRRARPENITLHDSLAQAKATGYRPCKRCKPDGLSLDAENTALIAEACRLIEHSVQALPLAALAAKIGLSESYFHRLFKAVVGLTPKAYASAQRTMRVRDALSNEQTVTAALYDAGFNSSGRFYENTSGMLGMTPSRYKAGGVKETIRFALAASSLGAVLVATSEVGVVSILLGDDPEALLQNLQDRFPRANLIGADRDYETLIAKVLGFVETPRVGLDLPLDVRGTVFQRRVWEALKAIPLGQTASYAEIAKKIGAPKAVRAVAGACAANPIALAIPCHRVVRTDGALSGYAWGIDRKRALLDREAD